MKRKIWKFLTVVGGLPLLGVGNVCGLESERILSDIREIPSQRQHLTLSEEKSPILEHISVTEVYNNNIKFLTAFKKYVEEKDYGIVEITTKLYGDFCKDMSTNKAFYQLVSEYGRDGRREVGYFIEQAFITNLLDANLKLMKEVSKKPKELGTKIIIKIKSSSRSTSESQSIPLCNIHYLVREE